MSDATGFGFIPISKLKKAPIKWRIENILPESGIVFVAGYAKHGKTTFDVYQMLKLTSGEKLFDRFKTCRSKCLYFVLEDHAGELKKRAKKLRNGKRLPAGFLVSKATSISLPADWSRIEADIVASKGDVFVIDSLRRAHELNEDSSKEISQILNCARSLAQKYGVLFIFVHHAGNEVLKVKEYQKNIAKTWLRGSSDLPASYDVLLALDRKKDGSVVLRVFHKYRSDLEPMVYSMVKSEETDPDTGDNWIIDLKLHDSPFYQEDLANENLVHDAISTKPDSVNGLQKRLKGKVSRPRIDESLERLFKKGKARAVGEGKATKWHACVQEAK